MKVAVIGASDKTDRYSYKAVVLLKEKGHVVFPVHPRIRDIEGLKVYKSIADIDESIDTVSLYVGKDSSDAIIDDILAKKPGRIIFNPGAENPDFQARVDENGIKTVNACTLVMLRTGQF